MKHNLRRAMISFKRKTRKMAAEVALLASFGFLLAIQIQAQTISIKPSDFDRFIMPCYLGSSSLGSSSSPYYSSAPLSPGPLPPSSSVVLGGTQGLNSIEQNGRTGGNAFVGRTSGQSFASNSLNGNNPNQPPYYGINSNPSRQSSGLSSSYGAESASYGTSSSGPLLGRDGQGSLGQEVPRANTIDNFIALVSKIETLSPRLASNPEQLIKALLSRFRMDNYYYDARSRTPISEPDRRTTDILPALLSPMAGNQYGGGQPQYSLGSDAFPEQVLDQNEKCSMYFMLSHFIDKISPFSPSLGASPINQLAGPLNGQRPPVLQAAGTGYPAQSANLAFGGGPSIGSSGSLNSPQGGPLGMSGQQARYPGPSPSFGSPATSNMNAYGTGINNQPEYTGKNPYGVNVPQPSNMYNQAYNSPRNPTAMYTSNSRPIAPYIDGMARPRDERQAIEYGVVALANQEKAALVLNRVLMGLLAASISPQSIRQLAASVYPTQSPTATAKIDEEIDPLYAVTLADLWAVSSIPKPGKPFDVRMLGDEGRWNDTMCPTSFTLDRSSSIRFTTAELLGGLDGFNLGLLRRRLLSMGRNMKLSELLRLYYSKNGFRPQFAEIGVCSRGTSLNNHMDELRRQAENYLRLYQLNLPTSDADISASISRLDAFREVLRQSTQRHTPQDLCQDSSIDSLYPANGQEQCEISRADVITVLDTSTYANQPFMKLVTNKLAQRLGLSRDGSSLTILTNQQDSTGYSGGYGFNVIARNSTNTAEVGCALAYDSTQIYQGSQVTDPGKLVDMFERAFVSLDSEYLTRQSIAGISTQSSSSSWFSSSYRPSYVSTWFGQSGQVDGYTQGGGPRNTGGAKILIWFNYGPQTRPGQLTSSSTNWNGPNNYPGPMAVDQDTRQYKFYEAKRYLRENFRGASILAVAQNRDDVKAFVYDEERDIFTDVPPGDASNIPSMASSQDYLGITSDSGSMIAMSGPAEQLVNRLVRRMCGIPALFQYPMCFRIPSENAVSVGYITPGRKQYWMMSPKTFFASSSVRLVFRVEGGRLRVCFGRKPNPDETALRNPNREQSNFLSQSGVTFGTSGTNQGSLTTPSTPSSSDYYTGLDYGVCKDVSTGQEIDFMISDPCYKKSIAECEPFYFVIKEISNPGEGDPNYMCRDEGCRRLDQVKFTMLHTGVTCSSALGAIRSNWLLVLVSTLAALYYNNKDDLRGAGRKLYSSRRASTTGRGFLKTGMYSLIALISHTAVQQVDAQMQAGVFDFGQGRYGEKRGNYTPTEVLSIILIVMIIIAGLAFAFGLCWYVYKKEKRGMTAVSQSDY